MHVLIITLILSKHFYIEVNGKLFFLTDKIDGNHFIVVAKDGSKLGNDSIKLWEAILIKRR